MSMAETTNQSGEQVEESFNAIRDELVRRAQELRDQIEGYVDEHPLAAVGAAFGIGYLLSGALFSRLTARVAGFAGRLAFGNVMRALVTGVVPQIALAALRGEHGNGVDAADVH
jgi:hypothetical protein